MHHLRVARPFRPSELAALDEDIRLRALAHIAGKRKPFRSLKAATQHFLNQGVRLHKDWVKRGDVGITGKMQSKAKGMGLPMSEAISLVGAVIAGETLRGGQIKSAAEVVADSVLNGSGIGRFTALMIRHLGQRAKDILRKKTRRRPMDEPDITIAPGVGDDEFGTGQIPADVVLEADPNVLSSDPMVRRWIEDTIEDWNAPSEYDQDIAFAWLDDPGRRGLKTDLARQYGVSATTIQNSINRFVKHLTESLERDRKMRKHWRALLLRSDIQDIQRSYIDRLASDDSKVEVLIGRVASYVDYLARTAGIDFYPNPKRVARLWLSTQL